MTLRVNDTPAPALCVGALRATEGALAAVIDSMQAVGEDLAGTGPRAFVDDEQRTAVFS